MMTMVFLQIIVITLQLICFFGNKGFTLADFWNGNLDDKVSNISNVKIKK